MANRFKTAEKLAAATRAEIPRVAVQWLAAARAPLEALTTAALAPDLSDEDFLKLVEAFTDSLPGLLDQLDHDALAELMESGMGAGMANGIAARSEGIASRSVGASPTSPVNAKLPWETDAWLAGNKNHDGKGRFARKASHAWPAASQQEAGILTRLTGRKFQAGARIHATEEGVRHAERGHSHQLTPKDWKQLKGRMFDQHTERSVARTAKNEEAISFKFQRGKDRMEAVFTIHFPHKKAPGELRLKTYAQRG